MVVHRPHNGGFGCRVQAKILDLTTEELEHLHYQKKSQWQCDKLLRRALAKSPPLQYLPLPELAIGGRKLTTQLSKVDYGHPASLRLLHDDSSGSQVATTGRNEEQHRRRRRLWTPGIVWFVVEEIPEARTWLTRSGSTFATN